MDRETLEAIRQQDPEGKPELPTYESRQAFKTWVIETYGLDVWHTYRRSLWDLDESGLWG